MSEQLESPLTKKIQKNLKERGWWGFKVHGAINQRRGLPDLIGSYHGIFTSFEVKRPGREATPLQAFTIKAIRKSGGFSCVITSVDEAIAALELLDKHQIVPSLPEAQGDPV